MFKLLDIINYVLAIVFVALCIAAVVGVIDSQEHCICSKEGK